MIIIIIPCFNEADRLEIAPFLSFIEAYQEVELLFVNDGSTDNTTGVINTLENEAPGRIFSLNLHENQGKAEAVRQGVLHALKKPCQYIGYWDADLATPLSAVPQFMECLRHDPERKIICGARVQRMGAEINRHWYRHYPGRVIASIISMIIGLPIYDTQCGAKLIERKLAERVFTEPFISTWLFDVELIARVVETFGKQEARKRILELPLERWSDIGASKIRLSYLPKVPYELIQIYRNYRQTNGRQ